MALLSHLSLLSVPTQSDTCLGSELLKGPSASSGATFWVQSFHLLARHCVLVQNPFIQYPVPVESGNFPSNAKYKPWFVACEIGQETVCYCTEVLGRIINKYWEKLEVNGIILNK